jgi:hypothetical protein
MTATTDTRLTLTTRIRRLFRQLRGGQDAIFRYDREFRA